MPAEKKPRLRDCVLHKIPRYCPACERERRPDMHYKVFNVPDGLVKWLRTASINFVAYRDTGVLPPPTKAEQDILDLSILREHIAGHPEPIYCPICFVEWVSVDMNEMRIPELRAVGE